MNNKQQAGMRGRVAKIVHEKDALYKRILLDIGRHNDIQMECFYLNLLGYSLEDIAKAVYAKFSMPVLLSDKQVKALIDAETILYGIASMSSDTEELKPVERG